MSDERYLSTAEVARRLDVKPETVYAYVSRGLLTSVRGPGRRGSLFRQDEVDRLAERGREGQRPAGAVERIRTELTLLDRDELYYRGHNVTELATTTTLLPVAHLLWTGELGSGQPAPSPPELVAMARSALAALPVTARLTDQLRVIVAVLAAADPLRFDLSPGAVVRLTSTMIGVLVDALRPADAPGGTLAERLWPTLTGQPPRAAVLDAALVLMADHDLAVSTVAARMAASARANPYAVVSAGLGAVDGHYHGAASGLVHRFLAEALQDPIGAWSERLRTGDAVPGFGHRVYEQQDPRAELLLSLLRDHTDRRGAARRVLAAVDTVVGQGRERGMFPNVDLALAAMMHAYEMRPDSGEAVFAIARTAGWIAHALEEYQEPSLRFRPLGIYTGQRPTP